MNPSAKIHVLKGQANLDDDSYRDLLERETGQRSSKGLSGQQRLTVITALEKLAPPPETQRATGIYAKKLQALWIAGYNLGVIHNRTDAAMMTFLKRQTGLDHMRFLQDAKDANKAIDALKLWIRRTAGSDNLFHKDKGEPPLYNDYRFQVCVHIWSRLIAKDAAPAGKLTSYLSGKTGREEPETLSDSEWIVVQNDLGKLWRDVGKKKPHSTKRAAKVTRNG